MWTRFLRALPISVRRSRLSSLSLNPRSQIDFATLLRRRRFLCLLFLGARERLVTRFSSFCGRREMRFSEIRFSAFRFPKIRFSGF